MYRGHLWLIYKTSPCWQLQQLQLVGSPPRSPEELCLKGLYDASQWEPKVSKQLPFLWVFLPSFCPSASHDGHDNRQHLSISLPGTRSDAFMETIIKYTKQIYEVANVCIISIVQMRKVGRQQLALGFTESTEQSWVLTLKGNSPPLPNAGELPHLHASTSLIPHP